MQFYKDIGIENDEDPLILMIAYKLRCETVWEISKEEFMNGFSIAG